MEQKTILIPIKASEELPKERGKPYTIICGRCFTYNEPDAKKCENVAINLIWNKRFIN